MTNCCQCLTQGLPVSLLSMLLALSGAGVLAAGVILKSYMGKKEELRIYQNATEEEKQTLALYVDLIDKTVYIVIVYGAWSAFVGLMGMVTFIANFVNKYTCIFNGNCSRVLLTVMYASIPCLSAIIETFKDQMSPKLRLLLNFIHDKDEKAFENLMQWSEWTRMLIYVSAACAVVTLLLISIGMCVFDTHKNDPKNPYNNYGTGITTGTLSKAIYRETPNYHDTSGVFNRQKPENVSQKYRNDPRDASFMDRTTEFDSTFHHRPTISHSVHMTNQASSNQASNQTNQMSTLYQTQKPSGYLPVDDEDDHIYDEYYEETYDQPYAEQYQLGQSKNQPGNQAGQSRDGAHQRLHSFVDSFESIN